MRGERGISDRSPEYCRPPLARCAADYTASSTPMRQWLNAGFCSSQMLIRTALLTLIRLGLFWEPSNINCVYKSYSLSNRSIYNNVENRNINSDFHLHRSYYWSDRANSW